MNISKSLKLMLIALLTLSTSGCWFGWDNNGGAQSTGSSMTNGVVELVFDPNFPGDDDPVVVDENQRCPAPVPEPMSLLLLAPALLGLLAARKVRDPA